MNMSNVLFELKKESNNLCTFTCTSRIISSDLSLCFSHVSSTFKIIVNKVQKPVVLKNKNNRFRTEISVERFIKY